MVIEFGHVLSGWQMCSKMLWVTRFHCVYNNTLTLHLLWVKVTQRFTVAQVHGVTCLATELCPCV